MRHALLATLLLSACGNPLPSGTTTLPTDARTDVVTEWEREPSLPTSDTAMCRADLDAARYVVIADDERFEELCAPGCAPGQCPGMKPTERCPYGCTAECVLRDCWGNWFRSAAEIGCDARTLLVVVHADFAKHLNPPRHGTAHALAQCTMGGDRVHTSDVIWSTGGVLDRAGGQPVR